MSFSLYAATIPSFRQTLGAVAGLLNKAEAFSQEKGVAPDELIQARLAPDMLPFTYQVKSAAVHSIGAIEGLRKGVFSPDMTPPPGDFATLKSLIAKTITSIDAIGAAEIDAFVGKDMRFAMGDFKIEFTAENFLMSFSMPNFYFHAATAYDILRWKGVHIGKLDFLGSLRKKG
jgi:uncharacterized protein